MARCTDCIHGKVCRKFCSHREILLDEKADERCGYFQSAADVAPRAEWISAEERLPEELTHVIVCDEDGTVGEAFYYKEDRFEWLDCKELAFVTHWMPFPEPPKGD